MNPSPNQPILFHPTNSFTQEACFNDRWQYRMFETDEIYWQFQVDPCLDATQIVDNPFFNFPVTQWTANGTAIIVGPFSFAVLPNGGSISQDLTTTANQWYQVNVNVSESSGNAGQGELTINGFSQTVTMPGLINRYSFYVKANSASTTIDLAYTVQTGSGTVYVNEISCYEVDFPSYEFLDLQGNPIADTANQFDDFNFSTWSLVPSTNLLNAGQFRIRVFRDCGGTEISWTSETICIIPENERDLLLSGCGNMNSFGSDFEPVIRLRGELMRGTGYTYPNRYTYQDSKGTFNNGYTRRNKAFTLKIDLVPEHVRDFVYMAALYNSIAVKVGTGTQVDLFLEEEPDDPVFPTGEKDIATITMRLMEKDKNVISTFDGDCRRALPPTVIGENEIERAIQTDNDELIQA